MISNVGIYGDQATNHRPGLTGDAVVFNGVNQRFELANPPTPPAYGYTYFSVVEADNLNADAQNFGRTVFFWQTTNNTNFYFLRNALGGSFFQIGNNTTGISLIGLSELSVSIMSATVTDTEQKITVGGRLWEIENSSLVPAQSFSQKIMWIGAVDNGIVAGITPVGHFSGKIKRIEILNKVVTPAEARRAYNEGTMLNTFPLSDFELVLDGDNYNTGTGQWLDTSPNAYVFTAVNAPTKASFL